MSKRNGEREKTESAHKYLLTHTHKHTHLAWMPCCHFHVQCPPPLFLRRYFALDIQLRFYFYFWPWFKSCLSVGLPPFFRVNISVMLTFFDFSNLSWFSTSCKRCEHKFVIHGCRNVGAITCITQTHSIIFMRIIFFFFDFHIELCAKRMFSCRVAAKRHSRCVISVLSHHFNEHRLN